MTEPIKLNVGDLVELKCGCVVKVDEPDYDGYDAFGIVVKRCEQNQNTPETLVIYQSEILAVAQVSAL